MPKYTPSRVIIRLLMKNIFMGKFLRPFLNYFNACESINFRENKFTEGLIAAISAAGEQLKKHFPHLDNDKNELPDDISFGKN